jgi:hypothetical protein
MALEGDHELLPRDTRGADDSDTKIPAHEVTSKAVDDTKQREPAGNTRPARGAKLTLSTFEEHEPAHHTVGPSEVKPMPGGGVMCYGRSAANELTRSPR